MKMKYFLLPILLLINTYAHALTISIAPIEYYVENESDQIFSHVDTQERLNSQLSNLFTWDKLNFEPLDVTPPKSFLDAMKVCNENGLDYLLYGFIEKKEFSLYGEIKLFDNERHEIIQTFFSSDNPDEIDRLISDLSGKISQYFSDLFNLNPSDVSKPGPEEGIFSFVLGGGYWMPFTTEWSGYIQSLYSAHFQIRFIPWRPAKGEGFRGLYFRTGLAAGFYHGINRPGFEELNLYNFTLGLPLSLCADIGTRHTISLNVEPQFSMDYLIINQLYNDTVTVPSYLFSGAADLEYQFHFTRHFAMSIGNRVTAQFLNPIRFSYNPYLLFEILLNPISGDKK